jgi:HEAT repeat protein
LRDPRRKEATVDILQLLADWRVASAERCLRRLWLEPLVIEDHEVLDWRVGTVAGKAIAALHGQLFVDFVSDEMASSQPERQCAAIIVAGNQAIPELRDRVAAFLDDPDRSMRRTALSVLCRYPSDQSLAARVWRLFEEEAEPSVRRQAAFALGVWRDHGILPFLLDLSRSADRHVRATSVSILLRFSDPAVADRLAKLAAGDPDYGVKLNAVFALANLGDRRAGKTALMLIQSADPKSAEVAALIDLIKECADLSDEDAEALRDILLGKLSDVSINTRLLAAAGLLSLHDEHACRSLWDDLQGTDANPTWRCSPIWHLARWRPSDFDPESLRPLLNDDDPAVRQAACLVAGQTRARLLISDLMPLVEDQNITFIGESVGKYASEALDRIAGKRPLWEPNPMPRWPLQ